MDTQQTVYGEFPAHFRVETLRNLCAGKNGIQTGPFGSQLHQRDYVPVGTPIITVEHLGENRILHESLPRVSDSDRGRLAKYLLQDGDIVFSRVGSVDRRALVSGTEEGWLFSGRCLRVRPDPSKVDSQYLSYFLGLEVFREYIRSIAVGATMPSLNTRILSDIPIVLPDISEQKAIAHVLGTLDDKVELNRRMNRTLEEMAQAIFQDWFVDFGPTRAKKEGLDPYLPQDLWELFPDRLVDSEFGNIPEKWEVKALSDCFNLTMGQSPPGTSYNDNGLGLPFFQGSTNFGFRFPEYSRYCTKPTREAKADDTLVSVRAPVGALNMAWERCCIGRGVAALRHKSGSSSFTYLSARNMQPDLQLYEQTGTVFGAITRKQFEALKILEPTNELIRAFDKLIVPLDCKIRNNMAGTHNLSLQRDAMLPKLVSGEIRVGVQY